MTLNQTLAALRLRTRPAPFPYQKEILRRRTVLFTGDAAAVWAWLRETGLLP